MWKSSILNMWLLLIVNLVLYFPLILNNSPAPVHSVAHWYLTSTFSKVSYFAWRCTQRYVVVFSLPIHSLTSIKQHQWGRHGKHWLFAWYTWGNGSSVESDRDVEQMCCDTIQWRTNDFVHGSCSNTQRDCMIQKWYLSNQSILFSIRWTCYLSIRTFYDWCSLFFSHKSIERVSRTHLSIRGRFRFDFCLFHLFMLKNFLSLFNERSNHLLLPSRFDLSMHVHKCTNTLTILHVIAVLCFHCAAYGHHIHPDRTDGVAFPPLDVQSTHHRFVTPISYDLASQENKFYCSWWTSEEFRPDFRHISGVSDVGCKKFHPQALWWLYSVTGAICRFFSLRSLSLHWRSSFLSFRTPHSTRWYHLDDIMTLCSLFSLFFFSVFVSVLADYKCVRASSTGRSCPGRSKASLSSSSSCVPVSLSLSLSLSNKQHRGLASYILPPPTVNPRIAVIVVATATSIFLPVHSQWPVYVPPLQRTVSA